MYAQTNYPRPDTESECSLHDWMIQSRHVQGSRQGIPNNLLLLNYTKHDVCYVAFK